MRTRPSCPVSSDRSLLPPRPRRPDPGRLREALAGQWRALVDHTEPLPPRWWAAPSRIPGWSNRELVAHIALGVRAVPRYLAGPRTAGNLDLDVNLDLDGWAAGTASVAADIDARTRDAAARGLRLADAIAAAEAALADSPGDRLVDIRSGRMRLADFLVTRLVEAVVHADDLDHEFPHERVALATVVRALADILAARAPGHAVEVRIPPYAAVQCLPGPRHTRGTPPNVVETDPLTWLRVATGRLSWASAVRHGQLTASGERADLSGHFPLLG